MKKSDKISEKAPKSLSLTQTCSRKPRKSTSLAQVIPTLPESKFFPDSGRNIHRIEHTASAKTSVANSVNSSISKPINLSVHKPNQSNTSIDCSMFSHKNEVIVNRIEWSDLSLPASPVMVLKVFSNELTQYEQAEILRYSDIYFIGLQAKKIRSVAGGENHGLDDQNGDYRSVLQDHIAYRYELLEVIGKGSFGQVFKVIDHKHHCLCALKILRNKKRFHQQAAVEIQVLKMLRKKDAEDLFNIVHIQSHFTFRSHACICFELLSMNLYEFLKGNQFKGLSLNLIKRFATQILQSLKLLSEVKVIHCDLKPENILLRQPSRSAIKIIDFGSSCLSDRRIYTYIQSRFYRAPEIILGISYTPAIDMWSFGCILVELYTGFPIFPGENEIEQLLCIMEYLGTPPKRVLERSSRKKVFFTSEGSPKVIVNSKGRQRIPGTKSLAEKLRGVDERFLKLIQGCLVWDDAERITPQQAIDSEWITDNTIAKTKD